MVRFFGQLMERVLDLVPHRLRRDVAALHVHFLVKHVIGNLTKTSNQLNDQQAAATLTILPQDT